MSARSGRGAAGRSAHAFRLLATALAIMTVACGGTPVVEAGDREARVTGAPDEVEETEPLPEDEQGPTRGEERTGTSEGEGGGGDERTDEQSDERDDEGDPFEEIAWALPPAGPGSPSVNEDPIYKVLDDLDPQACAALLDPAQGWFEPSSFGTGERSVHLFMAGAQLCAGDREGAIASYGRARAHEWAFAVEQPLHSRVCNVWDAVTRMLDPSAGPCVLEELRFDTPTDEEEPAEPAEPSGEATTEPGTEEGGETGGTDASTEPDQVDDLGAGGGDSP